MTAVSDEIPVIFHPVLPEPLRKNRHFLFTKRRLFKNSSGNTGWNSQISISVSWCSVEKYTLFFCEIADPIWSRILNHFSRIFESLTKTGLGLDSFWPSTTPKGSRPSRRDRICCWLRPLSPFDSRKETFCRPLSVIEINHLLEWFKLI